MAIKEVTVAFDGNANEPKLVHRAVAGKFSVEVKTPGIVTIAMRKKQSGPFVETDFEFLTLGQTIPAGAIFAKLVPQPGDQLTVSVPFEVRTRGDFDGQPQFSAP